MKYVFRAGRAVSRKPLLDRGSPDNPCAIAFGARTKKSPTPNQYHRKIRKIVAALLRHAVSSGAAAISKRKMQKALRGKARRCIRPARFMLCRDCGYYINCRTS
jgi:hypothetical protein